MAVYKGKKLYMGAWQYVLIGIVYSIPVIGWLIAAVGAFFSSNECRKHYARAFFVWLLLLILICSAYLAYIYFTFGDKALLTRCENIRMAFVSLNETISKGLVVSY